MKRTFILSNFVFVLVLLVCPVFSTAQSSDYLTGDQLLSRINQMEDENPGVVSSAILANSPGNRPLHLIRIGNDSKSENGTNPSVFVGANLEGNRPLATEGAIFLAETILADPANYESMNWYIVPLGNPDAAARYFKAPLFEDSRNDFPTNDDKDELTDEDGSNDLNGDGLITKMRVHHPEGEWISSESDPRLMLKADGKKGQQGVYKIYTEGIDDDADGKYNEDGPGGTNVGINFPQLFHHHTADGGLFPGSTPESYAIMKFVFEHPEIAMIVSFGSTNWCHTPPKGGRKGEADLNKIRLTERQAGFMNMDPARTYTLEELVESFNAENPQSNMDEGRMMGMLGVGAALNPQAGDLLFYEKFASEYKAYLKEQGVDGERFEPAPARDGSFELWGYFQVGVPVFSLDLWSLAKKDSISAEEAMLEFVDSRPGRIGFVEWEAYDHPSLGPMEIGGVVPYTSTTPPHEWADSLLNLQVPWILKLAGELPDLHIYETLVSAKGDGIYQVDIWIENRAFIPFPTHMGARNRQAAPAVLTLEGEQVKFISGYRRTPIPSVGSLSRLKTSLLIQVEKSGEILLKLESKTAGQDMQTIKIGG